MRVTAVGLCGSDRHWFLEGGIGDAALDRPLVLGHEFVGGDRVRLPRRRARCGGPCRCRAATAASCIGGESAPLPGPFASPGTARRTGPSARASPGPNGSPTRSRTTSPTRRRSLLEPLGVALHALDLAKARPGSTAGVFGCGPLGLLIVQALQAAGVETIVASRPAPAPGQRGRVALGVRRCEPTGAQVDVAFEVGGRRRGLHGRHRRPFDPVAVSSSSASPRATGRPSRRRPPGEKA